MLRAIQKFTINHGKTEDKSFSIKLHELEKFIDLQIARGVLIGKVLLSYNCGVKGGVIIFLEALSAEIGTRR